MTMQQVVIIETDRGHDSAGCTCGLCGSSGQFVAYSAVLEKDYFRHHGMYGEVEIVRLYAPTDEAAQHNVKMWVEDQGYEVVSPSKTQQLLAEDFCECDNGHEQNQTVCQFCYVHAHPEDVEALSMLVEHVSSWRN